MAMSLQSKLCQIPTHGDDEFEGLLCKSGWDLAQVEGQETRKSPDLIKRAAIGGMPGNQMALFALSWPAAAAVSSSSTPTLKACEL